MMTVAALSAAIMRFLLGKFARKTFSPSRKRAEQQVLAIDFFLQHCILGRICLGQRRADHGDCAPTFSNSTSVRFGINSACKPGHDRGPRRLRVRELAVECEHDLPQRLLEFQQSRP